MAKRNAKGNGKKNQKNINLKELAFIRHYFQHRDAYKAYIHAGYKARGANGVKVASEVLNRPEVLAELKRLDDEMLKKTQAEMLKEWKRTRKVRQDIAYSDISDIMDFTTGELPTHKPAKDIPKRVLRSVRKFAVEYDKTTGRPLRVEYTLAPKEPHLDALEDKFSILPDNERKPLQVDVTSGGQPIASTLPVTPQLIDEKRDTALALLAALRSRVEPSDPTVQPLNVVKTIAAGDEGRTGNEGVM